MGTTDQQYLPRTGRGAGSDIRHAPSAPNEQARYWIDGDAFPRIVLDVPNAQVLVGNGAAPPLPLSGGGGGGASTADPFVTFAAAGDLTNNKVLGTLFRADVVANRGAFGTAGQMFFATDTFVGYLDTGAAWLAVTPVLDGGGKIPVTAVPNLDFSKITTGTVPINQGGTSQVSALAARGASGLLTEGAVQSIADAPYTMLATDRVVIYTTLTAPRTVTLPAANAVNPGHTVAVCDASNNAGTNTISIARAGADTVDGGSSAAMSKAGGGRVLVSDGVSAWRTTSAWIGTNIARVTDGGTGAGTLTGLVKGNGTAAMTAVTAPAGAVVGTTDAQTLTNKRITRRIATLVDAATVTPDSDNFDGGILTTLSQATTLANPTGTPTQMQMYELRVTSAVSRAWTSFGSQYRGSPGTPLPAATTGGGKTDYFGFHWNVEASTWDLVSYNPGF